MYGDPLRRGEDPCGETRIRDETTTWIQRGNELTIVWKMIWCWISLILMSLDPLPVYTYTANCWEIENRWAA